MIIQSINENLSENQKSIRYLRSPNSCWSCVSHRRSKHGAGSPQLKRDGKSMSVYKYVYELLRGPLKPTETMTHTCGNPNCINPAHIIVSDTMPKI